MTVLYMFGIALSVYYAIIICMYIVVVLNQIYNDTFNYHESKRSRREFIPLIAFPYRFIITIWKNIIKNIKGKH